MKRGGSVAAKRRQAASSLLASTSAATAGRIASRVGNLPSTPPARRHIVAEQKTAIGLEAHDWMANRLGHAGHHEGRADAGAVDRLEPARCSTALVEESGVTTVFALISFAVSTPQHVAIDLPPGVVDHQRAVAVAVGRDHAVEPCSDQRPRPRHVVRIERLGVDRDEVIQPPEGMHLSAEFFQDGDRQIRPTAECRSTPILRPDRPGAPKALHSGRYNSSATAAAPPRAPRARSRDPPP